MFYKTYTSFAVHAQMRHAASQVHVVNFERREFFAPQPVVEQQGEEGAIAQGLQIVAGGQL
jgi:hypothetical protein